MLLTFRALVSTIMCGFPHSGVVFYFVLHTCQNCLPCLLTVSINIEALNPERPTVHF